MTHKSGKIPLSHDIDEEVFRTFENVCEELGPPKYRILEASIEVFANLPKEVQAILLHWSDDDTQKFYEGMGNRLRVALHNALAQKEQSARILLEESPKDE